MDTVRSRSADISRHAASKEQAVQNVLRAKLSRRRRGHAGQALVEYALAIVVLLGVFLLAVPALPRDENEYFTSLGRGVARTAQSFGTFPSTPPPTLVSGTPIPTATPFSQPSPTPTPDSRGDSTRTTLTCGSTSAIVPTSGPYQTTCVVTL